MGEELNKGTRVPISALSPESSHRSLPIHPCPEVSQFFSYPYDPGTPGSAASVLELGASDFVHKLRTHLNLSLPFDFLESSTHWFDVAGPSVISHQMFLGFLFLAQVPRAGEPGVMHWPLFPQGPLCL